MAGTVEPRELSWQALPRAAQLFVAIVIAAGAALALTFLPDRVDHPALFALLLVFAYLMSTWKVNLPLALSNGSTLSVSYAADLMSLLILGPKQALVIAMAGAWAQCSTQPKRTYPTYRTLFSVAVLAITMRAVAAVYRQLHGPAPLVAGADLTRPLLGIIATYFLVNTGLVALAIALATRRSIWPVWRDNFLWSAPSFFVAGGSGALAALVVARGDYWLAPLLAAPVYLTYRTYRVFLGRIEDARQHADESQRLHRQTIDALMQARQAERAFAVEKERLAVTLRSIGDGVIAADADGHVRLLNRAAEVLTGWSQEDALGAPLADVFRTLDPDTRAACDNSLARIVRSDQALGVARGAILVSRDTTEIPVQDVCAPLLGAGGQPMGIVVAFRDATDAIRIQEERAKASKLESLGLLAGGIAHDFNNILTAILGNVSLARAVITTNPQADAALVEAEHACVRARQLTQQLLTFSKGGRPVKKPMHLERVVKASIRLALSGSPIGWTARIDRDLWPVNADEGQLTQVFNNILINAQQAVPRGGRIVVTACNHTETEERWEFGMKVSSGPYVRVSVIDEGVGISPEVLGRIFEPYFSTKSTGSGLGLATSQSIVKNHGGYLSVETELGCGTTMHVNLPAAVMEHVAAEDPGPPLARAPRSGGRVLVLDDEESIRTLATHLLRLLGYEVETVSTGEAAIARYIQAREEARPFDIVLLDLTIPGGMGGGQVISALMEIDPDVRAIVVSGYASDALLSRYREHGFKAAVTKPFTVQELSAALDELSSTRA
jgi:PAS domain S-box-containing protein